jgi:small ligand-binding sensory domain FIST
MRAGLGISRDGDVRRAAREAARRALDDARLKHAGCILVGGTSEHIDQAIDLCEELRAVAGHRVQIVGGAVDAVLARGDGAEEGPALGVLALEQAGHLFSWRGDDAAQLRGAAQAAGPGGLLLALADPSAPLGRLTSALTREAAGLLVAGGGVCAEGGLLLDDDLAQDAGAVGVALPGPARVAVAQSHLPVGGPALVSRSEGRLLHELDGRPALEALARLRELPGLSDIAEALPLLGLGVAPAPGEPFREDDFQSVALLGVDEETGALAASARVPEGHSVCFTLCDGMGARRALDRALTRLAGAAPRFGLYFDCASRGTSLYGVDELDLSLIEKALGHFPLLSLRTSFELGPAGGGTGLHLFTGVLALAG